jgi:dUTPase
VKEIRAASQFVQDEPTGPIRRGERIAQMVIAPVVRTEFASATSLSVTTRGSGGFGSTGH